MSERDRERWGQEQRFLSRWSQRKLKRRGDETVESSPDTAPDTALQVQTEAAGFSADNAVNAVPLPSIDTLDESSDYSGFLSPDVTEELQRLALRKLFGSARFNVRDGLDDYDDDYRSFESLGNTITAEMRHHMERELDSKLAADGMPDDEPSLAVAAADGPEQEVAAQQSVDDKQADSPSSRSG